MNKPTAFDRDKPTVLSFRQLLIEAEEYRPGYSTWVSLNHYFIVLCKVVMHSKCPEIRAKAEMKLKQLQLFESIYNEQRN